MLVGCLTVWAPDGAGGELFRLRSDSARPLSFHCGVTLLWTGFFGEYLIKGVRLIFVISGKLTVNNKVR